MIMDEEEGEDSRSNTSEELDFESSQQTPASQMTRDELEEAIEEVRTRAERERKEWELEKRRLEEEIAKQAKLLSSLTREEGNKRLSWSSLFNSSPKKAPPPPPPQNPESSAIIDDLLNQIKELSMQRAAAMDTIDDLKDDLVDSKNQLRVSLMESVSMKTQIASLEEKVRLLEEDPQRPNTPHDKNLEDPFGNHKVIKELQGKLEDRDMDVNRLSRETSRIEKKVKQLTEDLSAQTSLAELKQKELNIVMQENGRLQKTIEELKEDQANMQKQLSLETNRREDLEKQLQALREKSAESESTLCAKVEDLEARLATKTEEAASLDSEQTF